MMNKHQLRLFYEWIMVTLAVISILIIILDYAKLIEINSYPYNLIDNTILLIFAIDYFTRLFLAKRKRQFMKEHVFDLLSIIPVGGVFTLFRITRVARLIRLLRIVRLIGLTGRLRSFLKTNGLIYYLYISIAILLITSSIYSLSEKTSFDNSLWWSITTATTVGYGDISPHTSMGRCAAVLLMLLGIGFVGMLTSSITSFFTNKHEVNVHAEFLKLQKENQQLVEKMNEIEKLLKENQKSV